MTRDPVPLSADLVELLPTAIVVVDREATVVAANRAAEDVMLRPRAEWVGTNGLELIHPDDLHLALVALESVQGKRVGTAIELRVATAQGWRLVEVVGAPYTGGTIVLSMTDLTQRRRWEVAADEDARFRAVVHNAAMITMLLAPDGTVLSVSGAATRMLGLDPERICGESLLEMVHPTARAVVAATLERSVGPSGGAPLTVEAPLARADGSTSPFELTIVSLTDDPTVEGLVVSAHDISRLRAATEEADRRSSLLRIVCSSAVRLAEQDAPQLYDAVIDAVLGLGFDAAQVCVFDGSGGYATAMARGLPEALPREQSGRYGVPGEVWRQRATVVVRDYSAWELALPELVSAGFTTVIGAPVWQEGELRAVVVAGRYAPTFEPYEIECLELLATQTAVALKNAERLAEQIEHEKALAHQAFHDPLTDLPNRRLFVEHIERALEQGSASGASTALLFVDLDDFKSVNDAVGHVAGDEILRAIAALIASAVREGDLLARLGGDEFAICCTTRTGADDARAVAERIIDVLAFPFHCDGRPMTVSASVGIAIGGADSNAETLLREADAAMYGAKRRGKGGIEVFDDVLQGRARRRRDAATDLARAIRAGEIVAHFQPEIDLQTGELFGFEALARWVHPERGLVPPVEFIEVAEETALINDIGTAILDQACRALRRWGDETLTVSVNLSPRQLSDAELPTIVRSAIARSGIQPRQLCLEVTESALMDGDSAADRLHLVKASGVTVAIDDFGTGYSSLGRLRRLPVDFLKIDRSFVAGVGRDAEDDFIVSTVVALARSRGLRVIAEGVETREQLDRLAALGCQLGQGFLWSPPVDEEAACAIAAGPKVLAMADVAPGEVATSK